MLDILTLYQNLHNKYKVEVYTSIGLEKPINLSPDVLAITGTNPTDFDQKSTFKIILRDKETYAIVDRFTQTTDGYMDIFDESDFTNFLTKHN